MIKAIVIGTSYGGLEALKCILPKLPENFSLPILVVLHIGDNNNDSFISYINDISKIKVKEAEEKEILLGGHVYFAPPNYHMLVEKDHSISFTIDNKVHYSRPSIDVLFESAAWAYGDKLIGIILTGLNQDGAMGLETIKSYGGITIVQNPAKAVASIMPQAAITITNPDYIIDIEDICNKILEITNQK
ncbi:chemotaxis protein CheB [Marinifilum sp. RC60d5]|uniref:chemotaxis protein CheB n=1 Tax=Marinifilum sp. RC60d5 TaxID=3458414 RepID=UPI0040368E12